MQILELIGRRFGMLKVLKRTGTKAGSSLWLCRCECGNTHEVKARSLARGQKSCLRRCRGQKFRDLSGKRFGHFLVLSLESIRNGANRWHCRCDCGRKLVVDISHLKRRNAACGHLRNRDKVTHGLSGRPEFRIWCNMRQRCTNHNLKCFENYGGRGIRVCKRWNGRMGFANFFADMGPRPSLRHSLDRFPDQNGNYEPGNVRWATPHEQRVNSRKKRWYRRPKKV